MNKKKKFEEPRAYQPPSRTYAQAPVSAEVNKDTHEKAMEKLVIPEAPKAAEPVVFFGAGSILFTVVKDEKTKKNYDIDFGPHFRYSTADPVLIELLRGKGYKEKGK